MKNPAKVLVVLLNSIVSAYLLVLGTIVFLFAGLEATYLLVGFVFSMVGLVGLIKTNFVYKSRVWVFGIVGILIPVLVFFYWTQQQARGETKVSATEKRETYQNSEHGFTFKYPSVYTEEEIKDAVIFRDNNVKITCEACDDPGKAFYIHVVSSEDYAQSYMDTFYGGTDTGVVFSKTPIKVIGAKEVVAFEDPGELHQETGYIIVRKNQSIIFSTTRAGTGSVEVLRDLPQVVTSFRFLIQ